VVTVRGQKGGVLSKLFIIPAGVVVIIGVFLLGYYMGRGQSRPTAGDKPPALPDVVSQYLPKNEDLTFYKTLTEKGEKNVSVDLRPKTKSDEPAPTKKDDLPSPPETKPSKRPEPQAKPTPVQTAKKEPAAPKSSASKVRYTIQIAAYPDRSMAEDEVRSMKRKGYAAFVVASNLPDKGTWYRVRVGSFANRQSAEKLAGELKSKEAMTTFVTTE